MEKLFNYLLKIGIEERPRNGSHMDEPPASFYRVTYGDDYFNNAPNHHHDGAIIALDYNTDAPRDYFQSLKSLEYRITVYCKKYGYSCEWTFHPWTVYARIEKLTDIEKSHDYYYFRDASIEQCNQYLHIAYSNKTPREEINAELLRIMNTYGESYKEFLQSTQERSA